MKLSSRLRFGEDISKLGGRVYMEEKLDLPRTDGEQSDNQPQYNWCAHERRDF